MNAVNMGIAGFICEADTVHAKISREVQFRHQRHRLRHLRQREKIRARTVAIAEYQLEDRHIPELSISPDQNT